MAKSKKVNKWEAAPESIRKLHNAFTAFNTMSYDELDDKVDWDELDGWLEKVLEEYNELEAKHNADCGLISKLEEENKNYDELECTINNLVDAVAYHKGEVKKLVETADKVRDKHENEVRMLKKDISDLQVKVKYYKEDIEDLESEVRSLNKQITRKNVEMCNLKWKHDETEKRIGILVDELKKQYGIDVTFYQKPGVDMHGLKNFGVHVDCEENRKAFNDLKETLDKHKSQIDKLEDKHAKATRFISRLTEALNDVGIDFHYVKIGDDGEEVFYIDSTIDKLAKEHYQAQCNKLRDIIHERTVGLEKLLKALEQAGIDPSFDDANGKWRIQYTDKAENAFLAADQIKRDAEKKIDKLVSALSKCNLEAKWDHVFKTWNVYVMSTNQNVKGVVVDICKVGEHVDELKDEIENLKSKNRSLQVSYNAVKKKIEELTAERDGLDDYAEALKKRLNAIYGYRDTDNPCGICKNFDPKE